MAEYISRDKAREIIENQQKAVCYNGRWGRGAAIDVGKYDELETVLDSIDAIPTAEVEPVRHGKWLDVQETDLYVPDHKFTITKTTETCSKCKVRIGFTGPKEYLFDSLCPNCGARMDGGADGAN